MRLEIFCIYDRKTGCHRAPFAAYNAADAQRIVVRMMETEVYGHFPDDFDLFQIGVFDDAVGVVEGLAKNELVTSLGMLADLVRKDDGK